MSEAAAAPAPAPAPKSGSKMMVIIVAAVLVAAAVGAGVYFMTGKKGEDVAAEAKGANKAEKPKLPPTYVKLDPAFVSNFESRGAMRFLQVSVELMTRDPAAAELIKQHDPMIRNDLLMLFGSQTYDTISTHEGKEKLRAQALDTVRKIVTEQGGKREQVEQLYFTSFVMQ